MKLWKGALVVCMCLSARPVFATLDPFWMFADSVNVIYTSFSFCDTARDIDLKRTFATDTGDAYSGNLPYYINFDYQFSSDSFIVKDPYDTNFVMYADLRPGYAGFKTAWDYGMTGFSVARYKYLVIAHKGPPAAHRVTVRAWYNDGGCGSPSYNEHLGTFSSSDVWKEDTIEIPAGVYNKPTDKERNQSKYYEFVFIVNNLDPNDTTSGPPGCLKIDNVRLVGCNPVDTSPKPQDVKEGEPATFRVSTSRADVADVLTFQWKRDGADIAGANDSVYTLASAKLEDAGVYTAAVTVSSTSLTFTSLGATLTVEAAEEDKGCGCGSGTAAALIPPFFFKAMAYRKRKKARKDMKA